MTWSTDIADAVGAKMREAGMSQRQLSRLLGVTHPWVGKRLRHEQEMSINDLEAIAKVLGFDALELVIAAHRQA